MIIAHIYCGSKSNITNIILVRSSRAHKVNTYLNVRRFVAFIFYRNFSSKFEYSGP